LYEKHRTCFEGERSVLESESSGVGPDAPRTALFLALADRELARAFRTAGFILGNAADAEEVTQDAILRAWNAWPRMRDTDRFGTWFERILVNACLDRIRRRHGVRLVALDAAPELSGADPFAALFSRDDIGRALAALPPDQRAVVVLRFWRDLSLQDIAERLRLPLGTVKSRLHYGLRDLRSALATGVPPEVIP
jgi:RNA polymerase sigma-70 factor (ECF subfamily)